MMKLTKPCIIFLSATFMGLLLYPGEYIFSQNHEPNDELNFGNVILVNGNHFKEVNIPQKGFLNHVFIWPPQVSFQNYVSRFEGAQIGILNQAIIYSEHNVTQFSTKIDQQGARNRLSILQVSDEHYTSKNDSTVSKKNSVTIIQKGNGNSATVIQN